MDLKEWLFNVAWAVVAFLGAMFIRRNDADIKKLGLELEEFKKNVRTSEMCMVLHHSIDEKLDELKAAQAEMKKTLDQIVKYMAREEGARDAREGN